MLSLEDRRLVVAVFVEAEDLRGVVVSDVEVAAEVDADPIEPACAHVGLPGEHLADFTLFAHGERIDGADATKPCDVEPRVVRAEGRSVGVFDRALADNG